MVQEDSIELEKMITLSKKKQTHMVLINRLIRW